jgi:hypothetical protein
MSDRKKKTIIGSKILSACCCFPPDQLRSSFFSNITLNYHNRSGCKIPRFRYHCNSRGARIVGPIVQEKDGHAQTELSRASSLARSRPRARVHETVTKSRQCEREPLTAQTAFLIFCVANFRKFSTSEMFFFRNILL